jgi:hypothetical protein
MLTDKIRCLVIRIPEDQSETAPRAAWREALPWADPYILALIRKLQREVRMERAARSMAAKEMPEILRDDADASGTGTALESGRRVSQCERENSPYEHSTAAAAGSPPSKVITAEYAPEGDEGGNPAAKKRRPRPR